jgi:pullulanase-type alpha-1,6-glucosidase
MRKLLLFVGLAALTVVIPSALGSHTPAPTAVTVAGSLQSELGCSGDWQPECAVTHLAFDAEDRVWQGTFAVPAGSWEYKAALNGTWDENYGANAQQNGANIGLSLADAASVKFYYDHATHWITSNRNSVIAVAPGSFQSELGCPGDWAPDCLRSWLQDPDADGVYEFRTSAIPPGDYEVKVAIDESWALNYGAGGTQNGPNIPFTVAPGGDPVLFSYVAASHVLTVSQGPPPQPTSVTIAGSLQSELGCPGDWQPECAITQLSFDAEDRVWQRTFNVPAGSWEYKAALNGTWDENYGANAQRNGANISLSLAEGAAVKFYYDHGTHWITSNRNSVIAVAPGSFQSELGCLGDWAPDCLRSWLQDPDGDGIYRFTTQAIPPGDYEAKVALNESWDVNYGDGGVQNGANILFTVAPGGDPVVFSYDAASHILTISQGRSADVNLRRQKAHWLTRDTLAWDPGAVGDGAAFYLSYAADGGLSADEQGITGGEAIQLSPAELSAALKTKFPHLASLPAFHIDAADLSRVPDALRGQVAVSAVDGDGNLLVATGVQIPGVLDDLYSNDARLGATFSTGAPTLRLWAPTAHSVKVRLYETPTGGAYETVPMSRNDTNGVWSVVGAPAWYGRYYLYEVEVWQPATMAVETNLVTDPYSVSLSRDSGRSQIVDLADPALAPAGWGTLVKPPLAAPEDIVLYELHVRDFSANDPTVPAALRGTYKAFTVNSNGMRHLQSLAAAGLTHVHLLPAFDFATIDEDKSTWQQPPCDLASFPPDSDQQQQCVGSVSSTDAFNWGYDPWHYTVPEGSYATNPVGSERIVEFRQMVEGLNKAGLRTVMDVVYNHTNASGQGEKSVLDRIVPGYYHRLNANGGMERSTCCENTAPEHAMMGKLVVDSVVTWAKDYKVDGFRFDIMGHHPKANMLAVRKALDELTLASDGVDGKSIYLYGEAWNFGEVLNDAQFEQARQANMAGTGIGSFNDRLRDGARGGGPFDDPRIQGFVNGLGYDPNGMPGSDSRDELLRRTDWVKIGLAGTLADFTFVDRFGDSVKAEDVPYHDQRTGFTADPQEIINYVEAHDNDTLFDAIQLKAPAATTLADRVRMQTVGLSLVTLAQGVPFIHAGSELLRSKSLDRNSYNSGDWFNRLDFTYQSNNWGVGLPPAGDNQGNWPIMQPLLANPALRPSPDQIVDTLENFRDLLEIRKGSPLFRLRTAAQVEARLSFENGGPNQVPGLVAMRLSDRLAPDLDPNAEEIIVLFNASDEAQTLTLADTRSRHFRLHKVQRTSDDETLTESRFVPGQGAFFVPARTTAVFVDE